MLKITTQWSGVQEVTGKLKDLERRGVEKIQRKAVTAWSQDVNKAAKARIVNHEKSMRKAARAKKKGIILAVGGGIGATKALRKSYGYKIKKYGSKIVGIVGARTGFDVQVGVRVRGKNKGQPIWHKPTKIDHLVEFGHGGPAPAPAYPHLRPAIDVVGDKPIVRELTQGLVEEVK